MRSPYRRSAQRLASTLAGGAERRHEDGGVWTREDGGAVESERELGVVGLAQDVVNGTAIVTQGAAEMASGVEDGASALLHGGIVFGEGIVEERMLGEECESEGRESGVEEVDDDDL